MITPHLYVLRAFDVNIPFPTEYISLTVLQAITTILPLDIPSIYFVKSEPEFNEFQVHCIVQNNSIYMRNRTVAKPKPSVTIFGSCRQISAI